MMKRTVVVMVVMPLFNHDDRGDWRGDHNWRTRGGDDHGRHADADEGAGAHSDGANLDT